MAFTYLRTIRFQDTDAAGVVYFANVLAMCHEAYEASLAETGMDLRAFFSSQDVIVPITHANVDFKRPMFCGDRITIELIPHPINETEFEVNYRIFPVDCPEKLTSQATTRHICVQPATRQRTHLPEVISQWLQQ